jgi:hypothetical protein
MTTNVKPESARPEPVAADGYANSDHADADATGVDIPVVPPQ